MATSKVAKARWRTSKVRRKSIRRVGYQSNDGMSSRPPEKVRLPVPAARRWMSGMTADRRPAACSRTCSAAGCMAVPGDQWPSRLPAFSRARRHLSTSPAAGGEEPLQKASIQHRVSGLIPHNGIVNTAGRAPAAARQVRSVGISNCSRNERRHRRHRFGDRPGG